MWKDLYRDLSQRGKLDMDAFCNTNNISYTKGKAADGRSIWKLAVCPFDSSHTDNDAAFFQDAQGKNGFKCFHESCKDRTWTDVRSKFNPGRELYPKSSRPRHHLNGEVADDFDLSSGSIDDCDFPNIEYNLEWMIKSWIVTGQNLMIGGPSKCLKTSVLVDLAVSVATGTPFLGRFEVPEPRPVLVVSGESGLPVLQDLRNRVVAAKNVAPAPGMLTWNDNLPCLTDEGHQAQLENEIIKHNAALAVIDPTYLALFAKGGADGASNVLHMGPILKQYGEIGVRTNCCMALVHHYRKAPRGRWRMPSLEDLSLSGFGEWSRQWMLLSRPNRYTGDGIHDLALCGGGPAAGYSEWSLSVNEGCPDDPLLGGRMWEVSTMRWHEREQEQQRAQRNEQLREDGQAVLELLRNEDEATSINRISQAIRKNWNTTRDIVNSLLVTGDVVINEAGYYLLAEPF